MMRLNDSKLFRFTPLTTLSRLFLKPTASWMMTGLFLFLAFGQSHGLGDEGKGPDKEVRLAKRQADVLLPPLHEDRGRKDTCMK